MIELQKKNFNLMIRFHCLILIFMLLLFSCNNRKSTKKDSFIKNKSEFENILLFLFLFSGSVYGEDLQWDVEQMEDGGAVAYVNGQITYGDRQRIWIGDSCCRL